MKKTSIFYLLFASLMVLYACDRSKDPIYQKINDNRYPVIFSNTTFVTPSIPTTGLAKGSVIKVELNFLPTDPVKEIQFYQKVDLADSTIISTVPYASAFSKIKNCDTLIYNYTVPSAPAIGAAIVVRARVLNQNGLFKDRTFSYKIK